MSVATSTKHFKNNARIRATYSSNDTKKNNSREQTSTALWKPYATQDISKIVYTNNVSSHPQPGKFDFTQELLDGVLYGDASYGTNDNFTTREIGDKYKNVDSELPPGLVYDEPNGSDDQPRGVLVSFETGVSRGTHYGPYAGKRVYPSEMKSLRNNTFMWEVFAGGQLVYFVDGERSNGNWMRHVKCARTPKEQNVDLVQFDGFVYYEISRDLAKGNQLCVWYSADYQLYMGISTWLNGVNRQSTNIDQGSPSGFECQRCGKLFAYRDYLDKHTKHSRCVDSGDRNYRCQICPRSFDKKDRLRIHVLHVHEKHRPHECSTCHKTFSQSSSLRKHTRVHTGEKPYKCVYCNRAFTASSILRTHLRQHNGHRPFQCKHCGKTFASHAAHDSHVKRSHPI